MSENIDALPRGIHAANTGNPVSPGGVPDADLTLLAKMLIDREQDWLAEPFRDEIIAAIKAGIEYLTPQQYSPLFAKLDEISGAWTLERENIPGKDVPAYYARWAEKYKNPSSSQADKMMAEGGHAFGANVPKFVTDAWPEHDTDLLEPKPLPFNKIQVEAIDDRQVSGLIRIEVANSPNEQATRILKDVLPKVLELYLNKSKDYNGNVMQLLKLGPKAGFVDLWRKSGKLKAALWDGKEMVGEQVDEILMDLVGHVLIILDELQQDS